MWRHLAAEAMLGQWGLAQNSLRYSSAVAQWGAIRGNSQEQQSSGSCCFLILSVSFLLDLRSSNICVYWKAATAIRQCVEAGCGINLTCGTGMPQIYKVDLWCIHYISGFRSVLDFRCLQIQVHHHAPYPIYFDLYISSHQTVTALDFHEMVKWSLKSSTMHVVLYQCALSIYIHAL